MTMVDPLVSAMIVGGAGGMLSMSVILPIALLFDRIVVWLDDRLGKQRFLLARQIAAELYRSPNEWVASSIYLRHQGRGIDLLVLGSGEVWEVRTSAGQWAPNMFERRILARAVQRRVREKLEENLLRTLPEVGS
jgi:hypothetical protein